MAARRPLVRFDFEDPRDSQSLTVEETERKRWYHHLPILGTALLILTPHPSLLIVLVNYHLRILNRPFEFGVHLLVTYTLTFLTYSSFIVCIARDPGPVQNKGVGDEDDSEIDVQDALMSTDFDSFGPDKWCRKCWVCP